MDFHHGYGWLIIEAIRAMILGVAGFIFWKTISTFRSLHHRHRDAERRIILTREYGQEFPVTTRVESATGSVTGSWAYPYGDLWTNPVIRVQLRKVYCAVENCGWVGRRRLKTMHLPCPRCRRGRRGDGLVLIFDGVKPPEQPTLMQQEINQHRLFLDKDDDTGN
jgi:hypothetical protein